MAKTRWTTLVKMGWMSGEVTVDGIAMTIGSQEHNIFVQLAPYVAAGFSFIGVVLGLIWSGYLSRKADARRDDENARERFNEIKTLRVALLADLSNLNRVVGGEKERAENEAEKSTWFPMLNFFQVYEANLGKIGLLQEKEAIALASAYYVFNEQRGYLTRFSDVDKKNISIFGNVEIIYADVGRRNDIVDTLGTVLESAKLAKSELEVGVSIPQPIAQRVNLF